MTSERKAVSNRNNAKRSLGPQSATGKKRASRNARKHGLTAPLTNDQTWAQRIESLALEIADKDVDHWRKEEVRTIAEAEFDVARVRAARTRLLELTEDARSAQGEPARRKTRSGTPQSELASTEERDFVTSDAFVPVLDQLILLDRYERRALARRQRAVRRLI